MDFNIVGAFILVTGIAIATVAFMVIALMRRKKDDDTK